MFWNKHGTDNIINVQYKRYFVNLCSKISHNQFVMRNSTSLKNIFRIKLMVKNKNVANNSKKKQKQQQQSKKKSKIASVTWMLIKLHTKSP